MPNLLLTLYSRSYCHLCQEMQDALHVLQTQYQFALEVLDVDADPALVARYDELVPVLVADKAGDAPVQLCHYFLDAPKVRAFLAARGAVGAGNSL